MLTEVERQESYRLRGAKISEALTGRKRPGVGVLVGDAQQGRPKIQCEPGCTCGKHTGLQQGRSFNKQKGYWVLTGVVHPLTGQGELSGRVLEHRVVLWDKLGCQSLDCVHPCHWCGRSVTWRDRSLKTDHLDEDKQNNDPDNLEPSCNGCNIWRGRRLKKVG